MTTMLMAAYSLTAATEFDYDFIYGTARLTMFDYVERLWGWDEDYQSARFRENFKVEEWELVKVDGKPAGCVNVQYRPREIFLCNIYILPEFQRRGIGSSIIESVLRFARETRRPVRLNVLRTNRDAFRLYVRLGFHIVETSPEKYLMSTD